MITIGIDPGNTHSAGVAMNGEHIVGKFYGLNADFKSWLSLWALCPATLANTCSIVCEMIASYGMAVGETVFETCVFIGELKALVPTMQRVTRMSVKATLCNSAKAKDANVRQRLIDLYGPPGTKKAPGATFGISGDMWAALAVATAYQHGCKLYTPKSEGGAK